jgi:hypothetical protein
MAITVSGTSITFNDATTQSTGFANPIPVANGGTGANNATTARANLGAGTGNGNGNGNGNGSGTVTSVATGNGLSGGTITSSGTLSVACPTFNTVGSYCGLCIFVPSSGTLYSGSNYSAGGGDYQCYSSICYKQNYETFAEIYFQGNLSGTWKLMSSGYSDPGQGARTMAVGCRVS